MADLFVSKTQTNGYVIGDDANDGSTKQLAKLTLESALTVATPGDTITINDGTYEAATFFAPVDVGLHIKPENPYKTTLTSTNTTRVIHQAATANGLKLGKFIIDSEANSAQCITCDSAVNVESLILDGTKLIGYTTAALQTTKLINLLADRCIIENAAATRIILVTAVAAGVIELKNCEINCTGATQDGIGVTSTTAGVIFKVHGLKGTFSSAAGKYCVKSNGAAEAHIYDNEFTCAIGSGLTVDNSAVAADAYVYNNDIKGTGDTNSTYGILIGEDGTTANDNSITVKRYDGNKVTNFNHGQMFGFITGAKGGRKCVSVSNKYGFLIKSCTSSHFCGGLSVGARTANHYLKGTTSCTIANGITVQSVNALALFADADGANNCATSFFSNMNTVCELNPGTVIDINASQDVTIQNHNTDKRVAVTGAIYVYGASTYTTANEFNTEAKVSGCIEVDSGYRNYANGNYNLKGSSKLRRAGVKWFTGVGPDTSGEPLPSYNIDIGHMQTA